MCNKEVHLLVIRIQELIMLFYVLFVCKCILHYCHRVSTQLQLKKENTEVESVHCVVHTASLYNTDMFHL
jgi:hypothetical protein